MSLLLRRAPRLRSFRIDYSRPTIRSASTQASSPSTVRAVGGASVALLATGLFAVYYFDSRSAVHRYFLTPVLRNGLDPEAAHKLAVKVLASGFAPRDQLQDDERLTCELWGERLSNPVGLAAGFDKDGDAVDGLFNLGFSWVEIGSVTPRPQPGNPRPRVFVLPDDSAMINRYGFPSQGHASVVSKLRGRLPSHSSLSADASGSLRDGAFLAINLGKNKDSPVDSTQDFVNGVKALGPFGDVIVVNVSSPNTPGLRGLQTAASLSKLLSDVSDARAELASLHPASRIPKLVLKLAPDLTTAEVSDIAKAIRKSEVDGVIVSNTTIARPDILQHASKAEMGGLSGPPLKPLSLQTLRTLRSHLPSSIPLIGCGGISTGADALEFARAGASLVQVYTAFGYDGVGACRRIKDELAQALQSEGTTWADVVAQSVREHSWKGQPDESDLDVRTLIREAEHLRDLLDALNN